MQDQPGSNERTQQQLVDDLTYGTPEKQRQALLRLSDIGGADALDAVINYLLTPDQPAAKDALDSLVVLALKYIPQDRYGLADSLIPFLKASDWEQRLNALRLLNTHPNELATDAVRELTYDAEDYVIEQQRQRQSGNRVLAERTLNESIMALANCGRLMALPDILQMIEDRRLRGAATRALGIIGTETHRLTLEDLAEDEDPRVRDSAQWGLGLMDDRKDQFLNPPTEFPEPPPERLSMVYWNHRQLSASQDDILQFLVVRMGLEHIILDTFLHTGHLPEGCQIVVRRHAGRQLMPNEKDSAELMGQWEYHWRGPTLEELKATEVVDLLTERRRVSASKQRLARIDISYSEALSIEDEGMVSIECEYEPFADQILLYKVYWPVDGYDWTFARRGRTWKA